MTLSVASHAISVTQVRRPNNLGNKIRWGEEPDNPLLISNWLKEKARDQVQPVSVEALRTHYESQFKLLLETVMDELIPAHWRCICLDHIHKPLQSLWQISDSSQSEDQLHRLRHELAMQSHYVRYSLRF